VAKATASRRDRPREDAGLRPASPFDSLRSLEHWLRSYLATPLASIAFDRGLDFCCRESSGL